MNLDTRDLGQKQGIPLEARSAGTLMIEGAPADPHAVAVCAELGIDIAAHRSMGLTQELLEWADWVLAMEFKHARFVREMAAESRGVGEVVMLGHLAGQMEIADPVGGWQYQFRRNRDVIGQCVSALMQRLRQ